MNNEIISDTLTTPNEADRAAFLAMHPNKKLMGCNLTFGAIIWIPIAGALHEFTDSWIPGLVALILPIAWILNALRKTKADQAQILKQLNEWQVRVVEGIVTDYELNNRNLQQHPTKGSHAIKMGTLEFSAKPAHLRLLRYGAKVRLRMFHAYNLCHAIEILGYEGHDLNWTVQSEEPIIKVQPLPISDSGNAERPYSRTMLVFLTVFFGLIAAALYGIWGWNPGHWVVLGFWLITIWVLLSPNRPSREDNQSVAGIAPPLAKTDQKVTGILGSRSIDVGGSIQYFWGIGNHLFEMQEADFVCAEPGDWVEISVSRRSPWARVRRLRRYLDTPTEADAE